MGKRKMTLDVACITNAGGRTVNQDFFGVTSTNNAWCLIVADGVGGYNHGEYASQLVVQYMKESFLAEPKVEEGVLRAHIESVARKMSILIHKNPTLQTMRTTLAVLYLNKKRIVGGYIGDSRIYILSDHRVFYTSKDHSVVMQMALRGELCMDEMRSHPKRNLLTSSIGKTLPRQIDTVSFDKNLSDADGILLCSDGCWELLAEEEMLAFLAQTTTASEWLVAMDQRLCNRQSNRSDNYTCLAARLKGML